MKIANLKVGHWKIGALIKNNLLLILIFLVAALVRTWDIPNSLIFFADAGHDLLVAEESIQQRTVPLLGIASSVPRFKQGPVTIWFEMALSAVFGQNLAAISLGFITLSLLSLVAVYEFCDRYLSQRISIIATYLMALSPLAIAQARMPYHTNPIPLATALYLFALVRLFQKKPGALFWAVLAWAFLFQFELAVFPTLLVIPWVLYRTGQLRPSWAKLKAIGLGLVVGLLPQLVYDLTHRFSQLGMFGAWVGYRLVSLFGGEHSFSLNKIVGTISSFHLYGGRIFSTDRFLVTLIAAGLIGWAIVTLVKQWRRRKIELAMEVVLVFAGVLTLGYFLHGSPSEAYFPPFIVVLPLLVAFALSQIFKKKSALLTVLLVAWGLLGMRSLISHRFFVSNTQAFSYGCSVKQQRQLVEFIGEQSGGDFKFATTTEAGQFASTFDNLRWLAKERAWQENPASKKLFYLENKNSPLRHEPNLKMRRFGCHDVYYYE